MTAGAGTPVAALLEEVWRAEAPHVIAALLRRTGDLASCEDAAQEALVAASRQWPTAGVPDHPRGWLIRVASRRLIDDQRAADARRAREELVTSGAGASPDAAEGAEGDTADDPLLLLLLCCHPALSPPSQVALTLRAVGGLQTPQIAAAFLVPEATMAQRISRAKATLRAAGARFELPPPGELEARMASVRQVLYLVFNEGYTTTAGERLQDRSLASEAIRLAELLVARRPDDGEAAGLLALMLLTNARAAARTDADGELVPLAEQDRTRWDRAAIDAGRSLVEQTLPRGRVGPFQLQAAIAACHADATTWEATDWLQVSLLYRLLERAAPGPMVTLNRAVAVAMAHSPAAGLELIETLGGDQAMLRHHRFHAVRAHLLEMDDRPAEAYDAYREAARRCRSQPEQRYLHRRAAACAPDA